MTHLPLFNEKPFLSRRAPVVLSVLVQHRGVNHVGVDMNAAMVQLLSSVWRENIALKLRKDA